MGLGQVYAQALEAALAGKAKVYRYADALTTLWSDKLSADIPIVIVWDRKLLGESPDDRLLEKHLTPLDWALAWSLKKARAEQSVPSIVIIDATAGNWKDTWAWSVRHQLLADMPWVTLSAPLVRMEDEPLYKWTFSKTAMDNGGVAEDGLIRKKNGAWGFYSSPGAEKPDRAPLEWLNNLWTASLRLSDENHDINNIVGARLMLEMFSARRSVSKRTAPMRTLIAKAKWSGLKESLKESEWGCWALPNAQYLYGKTISAILVDDKHESGWATFLEEALGNDVNLRPMQYPDELIEFLDKQKNTFKYRDFIASISGPDEKQDARPEIIFLDLRLYGSGESRRLKKDVEKLLAIAERWEGTCPAWEAIPQGDLDKIRSWLKPNGATSGTIHLEALLLLPRLLALALPLTPIILFSATGQALVQKKLKPYRNIFTNFQKPNPLADPDSVPTAVLTLHQALNWAAPMLRRRLQLAYVQRVYDKLEANRPTERPSKHFEIYFDESGSGDQLISTAVVGVFANKEAADAVQARFVGEFSKSPMPGISWARRKDTRHTRELTKAEEFFANQRTDRDRITANKNSLMSITNDVCFNIISAKVRKKDHRSPGYQGALGKFVDHKRLDDAIRLELEMSLLVLFGYTNKIDSVGIFIQTKSSVVSNEVKFFETMHYFTKGMAFPLVRAWLQMWGEKYRELAGMLLSIRSQKLSSNLEDTHLSIDDFTERRALHDIADWGAAFVGLGGQTESERTILIRDVLGACLFDKLYYSDFNSLNCEILSDALRSLVSNAQPYTARAIHLLCSVPVVEDIERQPLPKVWNSAPQEYYWLWAIFPYISEATGADLVSGLN
jgi:hypothetical protein